MRSVLFLLACVIAASANFDAQATQGQATPGQAPQGQAKPGQATQEKPTQEKPTQEKPTQGKPTQGKPTQGQRRAGRATVALAIYVTDPAGASIPDVLVTLEGATERTARTEGGRIAFENLPAGSYRLRFEREGFITLERELTARAGAPIDVKVTLRPAPAPPPPPPAPPAAEPEPAEPDANAKPAAFDVPSVIEKEWVGRGPGKTTPLACGSEGSATLIQIKEPLTQHTHDADEFIYVVAGEGNANVAGRDNRMKAGVLVFVPRGVGHGLTASGRNPLVVLSTRAGQGCTDGR